MAPKVTVYTTRYCPYCDAAKRLLNQRGISFEEIRLADDDDQAWDDLCRRSGMQTVPQIFADEKLIGGYRELSALDQKDSLESLKGSN